MKKAAMLILEAVLALTGCGAVKTVDVSQKEVPYWLENPKAWVNRSETTKYFEADGITFDFQSYLNDIGAENLMLGSTDDESLSPDEMVIMVQFDYRGNEYRLVTDFIQPQYCSLFLLYIEDGENLFSPELEYSYRDRLGYEAKYPGLLPGYVNMESEAGNFVFDKDMKFFTSFEIFNDLMLVLNDDAEDKECPFDGLMNHASIIEDYTVIYDSKHQEIDRFLNDKRGII